MQLYNQRCYNILSRHTILIQTEPMALNKNWLNVVSSRLACLLVCFTAVFISVKKFSDGFYNQLDLLVEGSNFGIQSSIKTIQLLFYKVIYNARAVASIFCVILDVKWKDQADRWRDGRYLCVSIYILFFPVLAFIFLPSSSHLNRSY